MRILGFWILGHTYEARLAVWWGLGLRVSIVGFWILGVLGRRFGVSGLGLSGLRFQGLRVPDVLLILRLELLRGGRAARKFASFMMYDKP